MEEGNEEPFGISCSVPFDSRSEVISKNLRFVVPLHLIWSKLSLGMVSPAIGVWGEIRETGSEILPDDRIWVTDQGSEGHNRIILRIVKRVDIRAIEQGALHSKRKIARANRLWFN